MATTQQILADYAAIDYTPPYALAGQPTATLPAAPDPTLVAAYQPLTNDAVISAIEGETYTLVTVDAVIREYQGAFGTVPDQGGVAFWVHAIDNGTASLATLSIAFANSPQFATTFGGANATTPANTALVTAMYQNVLGRAPDAPGLAFWLGSGLNAAQLLQAFTQSAEDINLLAPHIVAFQNLEAAGNPALVPVPPTSLLSLSTGFTLTPGIDTFTATDPGAVFNALPVVAPGTTIPNNTLNTGDNLLDTKGDGTLNFTAAASTLGVVANPPFASGVTTKGVSTLNVTNNAVVVGFPFVAGFAGNVTDLTTVNDNASLGTVQLGQLGQGLNTLLTNVNVSGYSPQSAAIVGGTAIFAGIVATKAADATKTINVAITGPVGSTKAGGADTLIFSNDTGGGTAASPDLSYGTWGLTLNSNANLTLQQDFNGFVAGAAFAPIPGGVGAATAITLAGKGNVSLGQDAIGNWQLVKDINASAESGTVIVTGATAGNATNANGSVNNPGWLFGSNAGLLDDTGTGGAFNLTKFELGSGTNVLDVSSASALQMAALVTTPNATPSLTNEIIVQDSVATTLTAATFAGIAGFQTLGIGGPTATQGAAGTIDMTKLPGSIGTIDYFTAANGPVTINNQTASLTVNTEDNALGNALTVGAIGPAAGFSDNFHLIVGDTFHKAAGAVGPVTLIGDELVTITSQGADTNTVGFTKLTPTAGGDETVTIDGDHNITIGSGGLGAIADVDSGGALINNNMKIIITDTGVIRLHAATTGPLFTAIAGDPLNGSGGADPLTNSTNARLIDASKSGGLIMEGGDASYVASTTIAGSLGDVIIGSATAGNVLGGSIGTDTFTLNNSLLADTVFTSGGAGSITLQGGHTASNSLDIYSGFSTAGVTPGNAEIVRFASITTANDVPELGWFGQPTGITATGYSAGGAVYAGLAANTGTSDTATSINNFNPGSDILQLSDSFSGYGVGVHGANGIGAGVTLQLVNGGLANFAGAGTNGTGFTIQQVNPGNTLNAGTNLIELTTNTFATATAVANGIHTAGVANFNFAAALGINNSAHMYVAYSDGTNTHIADVAFINASGAATAASTAMTEHVSDVAILVGTSLTSLSAADIHFMHG